jgi:ferredoxin--NADP+ reductase
VPDGPLTSKLQHVRPGDEIILRPKPVGTLVHDALLPGRRLWMFATGTGFAPFASLLRDPETWEKYDEVVMTHTCREVAELSYGREIVEALEADELIGEMVAGKLRYYPTTTREESPKMGRITTLLETGEVFAIWASRRSTPRWTGPWSAARWPSTSTSRRCWKRRACAKGRTATRPSSWSRRPS